MTVSKYLSGYEQGSHRNYHHSRPYALSCHGGYHVPKRDLIFALLAIYQSQRIKVAEALPLAKPLVGELTNLKLKINTAGHDSYSAWRESEHDDLVLSLALSAWYGEYRYTRHHRRSAKEKKGRRAN